MKRPIIVILFILVFLSGAYLLLLNQSNRAAAQLIDNINKTLEASFGDVQITYDDLRANVFQRSAVAERLVFSISGDQIFFVDQIEMSGDMDTVQLVDLSDLELTFTHNQLEFNVTARHLQIEELKLGKIQGFFTDNKDLQNMLSLILDEVAIARFETEDFLLLGKDLDKEVFLSVNGDLSIQNIKRGAIENINAIGTVKNNATYFDIIPFDFEVDKLGISNLDLKSALVAVNSDQPDMLRQLNRLFGITKLDIENSSLSIPDEKLKLTLGRGDFEIEDSKVQMLLLENFTFRENLNDKNYTIAEFSLQGLDLSINFLSEEEVSKQASRIFGIEEMYFKDVHFKYDELPVKIDELGFTEIETNSEQIVSGKTFMSGLQIPLSELKKLNQKVVEEIAKAARLNKLEVSLKTEFDYDQADKEYYNLISLEFDRLADFEFVLELSGFDPISFENIQEDPTSIITDILGKEIQLRKVQFDYIDYELADTIFRIYPQITKGLDFLRLQASLLLFQYSDEKELLINALNNFEREKNEIGFKVLTIEPFEMAKIPELFLSGQLNDYISFEAYGN